MEPTLMCKYFQVILLIMYVQVIVFYINDLTTSQSCYFNNSKFNEKIFICGIYLGTICKDALKIWQWCTTGQQYDELYINQSENQYQNENNIVELNSLLGYNYCNNIIIINILLYRL